VPPHYRVRQDKVNAGKVTLRYKSQLFHIAVGRKYNGRRVLILAKDRDVRIVTHDGEVLRHLTLDPKRIYQPQGDRKLSTMSRDITIVSEGRIAQNPSRGSSLWTWIDRPAEGRQGAIPVTQHPQTAPLISNPCLPPCMRLKQALMG
jgi:hypothetical protein